MNREGDDMGLISQYYPKVEYPRLTMAPIRDVWLELSPVKHVRLATGAPQGEGPQVSVALSPPEHDLRVNLDGQVFLFLSDHEGVLVHDPIGGGLGFHSENLTSRMDRDVWEKCTGEVVLRGDGGRGASGIRR